VSDNWKNIINNNIIIEAVTSYLVWAKDFLWNNQNIFDVWLIPDGHHIYTWTLKAAWYRLLKPAKTLVLIGEGAVDNKVCVLNQDIDNCMWKKFKRSKKALSVLSKLDFVEFVEYEFDRIGSELPFVRIVSNCDNIVFLEIGSKLPKVALTKMLLELAKIANLMFISDFHRNQPMDECKRLDSKILDFEFIKNNKDLHVIESFLNIANKIKKKPLLLSYLNTWDISTDKNTTNWFWCVLL